MAISAVGIPWYRREDYPRILRIMRDRKVLPPTYDAWLVKAKQVVEDYKRKGSVTFEAYIDPDTFPDWCRSRGLHVDAGARMEYANLVAMQRYQSGNA